MRSSGMRSVRRSAGCDFWSEVVFASIGPAAPQVHGLIDFHNQFHRSRDEVGDVTPERHLALRPTHRALF